MRLNFTQRIVFASVLLWLVVAAYPQSAKAMTIRARFGVFRTQIQDQGNILGNFRMPSLFFIARAEVFDTETEKERLLTAEIKAAAIDRYMKDRSMPLADYASLMVQKANEYDMDWRLLPAIAIRESSGGKFACGNNPFGWASCKINFRTMEEAIDTVARNLGGHNPNTAVYYRGDTSAKLQNYNGSVIPRYPEEVMNIMNRIAEELAFL